MHKNTKLALYVTCGCYGFTVEPPNEGRVGTSTDVRYSEVVGEFLPKILYFTFLSAAAYPLFYILLTWTPEVLV